MLAANAGPTSRAVMYLAAVEALAVVALAVASTEVSKRSEGPREINRLVVRELKLTDLALSTGTSYCRHPSQADLFSPRGDHPSALERFPAGSIVAPPAVTTEHPPANGFDP